MFCFFAVNLTSITSLLWPSFKENDEIREEIEASHFTSCYIDYLTDVKSQSSNFVEWWLLLSELLSCALSTIETKLKQVTVNLPSDYINVIQRARKKGEKYWVKHIDYTFFKDFKAVCHIKSVNPSKEVGPPYANDIHLFQYTLMVRYLLIWITLTAFGKRSENGVLFPTSTRVIWRLTVNQLCEVEGSTRDKADNPRILSFVLWPHSPSATATKKVE